MRNQSLAQETIIQGSVIQERLNQDSLNSVQRMEAEFARLLRAAVSEKKFGQFGVIVSLQSGHVKTYQTHAVETLK